MRPSLAQKVRRDAAKVLASVLLGDAKKQANASIKSLVYSSSISSKQATLALTCHTLRYLPLLKQILSATDLGKSKPFKVQVELLYVLIYELLFGQQLDHATGNAEKLVLSRKTAFRAALARLLVKENVSDPQDLLPSTSAPGVPSFPRYVRVNTLKSTVEVVLEALKREYPTANRDNLIDHLLVLPPATDLHQHPLVKNGSILLQGKSSCMPAQALAPEADWHVLDACAAPGNKTAHLAALMQGRGRISACELDPARLKRLQQTVQLVGATNVEVLHQDFLKVEVHSSRFSDVKAILLDPSCSGSGTSFRRLDHLLPSSTSGKDGHSEQQRVEQLARFQEATLRHALSFPNVEKVAYSTCSIHQRENEDVISTLLDFAASRGFQLVKPFPEWPHRGLPVFNGAHHVLRTAAERDNMDGFFLALFSRKSPARDGHHKSISVFTEHQNGRQFSGSGNVQAATDSGPPSTHRPTSSKRRKKPGRKREGKQP